MNEAEGQVFDLGYRPYDGPREGRWRALRALFANGVRSAFGVGRGAWAKVLPALFLLWMMAPAAALAALTGLFGEALMGLADLPGPEDYYGFVSGGMLIFAALIAPELLCPDRRDGVISLYLVRPITTLDYLLGRWLAFFSVSLACIYAGQTLLLAGLALSADSITEHLSENWLDLPRSLGAGAAIAVFVTAIPLAAASLTDRRAYAIVGAIGLFTASSFASAILGNIDSVERWASLINVGGVPIMMNDIIFGVYEDASEPRPPMPLAAAWYAAIVAGATLLMWSRYRKLAT